jgi:hypothetical protein
LINDEVGANRLEQNRVSREVLALMPHPWVTTQYLEGIKESCYPPVCGVNAIDGNLLPDIVEVEIGIDAEHISAHAVFFRRSSDLL